MLAKSIPSMFDNKASTWPDPEQSIGKECLSIGELRLWLPIGPALAVYELLSKDLKDLLDNHKDALKQGEPKPRSISFSMWMIGAKPKSSNPTIVFSSKSRRQRVFAKALLKDSRLLVDYPGVRIKTLERKPAIYQAGSQEPDTIEMKGDSIDNVHNDGSEEEAVHMVDDSRGSCGALIAFGRLRLATMGGTLLINGTYYGISAQHGRYKFLEEPEDAANEDNPLRFDDDSDTEDSELENLVEITSRESISSFSDDGSSTVTFTSTTSTKDGSPGYPIGFSRTTESTLDNNSQVPSPSQPTYSSNPKISNLLPLERNDLDYEIFELGDSPYHNPNKIDLPGSGHPSRRIIPNKVARTLVECPVWAATGTTGCVQGTMMRQPHYIKMEGSETFQEMWAVKLDRNTKPGDSGAWVVDSAGQLFGHIVAGDPILGLAFITPAYKIFDDIKSRFGEEPLLCPSTSVTQLYSAPNDGEVAEQRLLDLIKGEETIARIHLSGFGGHGKTLIARQYAHYVTSIGGHLVEEIAKRKEIAEMRLKQDAANWTLPDRIADFLQAMVQELLHNGAEAVYRGNILDTFLILTGTFNQLMPATFNATASYAKPTSFGSFLTTIGAYPSIDFNWGSAATSMIRDGSLEPTAWTRSPRRADIQSFQALSTTMIGDYHYILRVDCKPPNGLQYTSPERAADKHQKMACDIFSLGCVFLEIAVVCKGRTVEEFDEYRCKADPKRDDYYVGYEPSHLLLEDPYSSTDTSISCCGRRVAIRGYEPLAYEVLSHSWGPPTDLQRTNDWVFGAGFSTDSLSRLAYQRKSSTIGDQKAEPFLDLSRPQLFTSQRAYEQEVARALVIYLKHLDDTWITCPREQAIPFFWDLTKAEHYDHRYHTDPRSSTFDGLLAIRLHSMNDLRRHEDFGWKELMVHVLQSHGSGAVPTYDALQSMKRLLNALRRRDDNSQRSELREWERHNWYLFNMALMFMGMDRSDPLLHHQIETYFQEYFLSALSGVTEGGFFVERSGHVRRHGFGVGSRNTATTSSISRVGEDVL